ncbi:hypothetical protein ACPOL_7211 (plasmid) [Acidisarcina polymorpha]|uniref:Uncharacterized protein n=1 Tax=Acidisarcina polymorpha TaxID=2211140 RepID=A0A2Z5GBI7_9BACT|nr:hypothetical protein ACPOL_7211 [Acidisarcina polymorpha]
MMAKWNGTEKVVMLPVESAYLDTAASDSIEICVNIGCLALGNGC